jgi:ATP-dependent exoDNAse (exonuclease V) beta subunit
MTFEHIKLPELDFDLEAVTTESGRTYKTPNGDSYPSITTVLSSYNKKAIYEWRQRVGEEEANKISTKASNRGTKLHLICEDYLLNKISSLRMQTMMPDTKELFLKLKPYIDSSIGTVYAIEQPLYSTTLKIAGRVDCIAEWEGELAVIDFKTSTKEKWEDGILNYFMQCSAYAEMFGEITGKPINKLVVAIAVEEGKAQIFVRDKKPYLPQLKQYIAKYYLTNT